MNFLKPLFFLATACMVHFAAAQTNQEKAVDKAREGIRLIDNGDVDAGIPLLKEAQKLDPENINYPYELGYAYYAKADYKQASKYLEETVKHKDVSDRVFQLLGNSYDNLGKSDKAIETYEQGLKLFPNSGKLYLELGIIQMMKKEYGKALSYFEKGIELDPGFSSNYYWAAKLYCSSDEEVWGMIYGELFMNLERNSKRTSEMSKLLYDTYASEIQFTSDTTISVSFSKNATVNVTDLKDPAKFKLPFGIGVYEPTLMLSMLPEHAIDLYSLDRIRTAFLDAYFKNGHASEYPNVLFDYQRKLQEAGQFEAYNHWLLMKGDEDAFQQWQATHTAMWDRFVNWFGNNPIKLDRVNRFYADQYR